MPETYRWAQRLVIFAFVAVVIAGGFIVRAFVAHVTVPCKGTLEEVSLAELTPTEEGYSLANNDLKIDFDGDHGVYKNVRVRWERTDASCSCREIAIPWSKYAETHSDASAAKLSLWRDANTGLFMVRAGVSERTLVAFRKTERNGNVFLGKQVFETNNVSMLILLGAFGALGAAAFLLLRALPYATNMNKWRAGTLRLDGLVESENGASIGRIGARVRMVDGDVIVNPSAFEGRDVYREMPILERKDIAPGTHDRWARGTMRRLRDARMLSILATATTGLAVMAHFFAG